MKSIKYILIFAISVFAFVSCNSNDTEGTVYDATNNEVSFPNASSSYTFGAEDPDRYEIVLQRSIADGAASVAISLSDESGLFTSPESVNFADGVYEVKIPVTFDRSQLVVGQTYPIEITVPANPVKERIVKHTLNITRDYVWEYFAAGTFSSGLFGEWEQEIQKADGAEAYKLPSVIAEGFDMTFYVAEDGSISFPGDPTDDGLYRFATGYVHPSYGMIYFELYPDPEYSGFDKAGKLAVLNGRYVVLDDDGKVDGGFGRFDEILTW
jgi:hypothetical protein